MRADPTNFTTRKELVRRERLVKAEDPEDPLDHPDGVFLELWEDEHAERVWALSIMDDYRDHCADASIHIRISDEEAGWIKRVYTEAPDDG